MSGQAATPRGTETAWILIQYATCDGCGQNIERVVVETPAGVVPSPTEDGAWIHDSGRDWCV